MYYTKGEIENCTGYKLLYLMFLSTGQASVKLHRSCLQIAKKYKSSSYNGQYWIKPSSSNLPFRVRNNLII